MASITNEAITEAVGAPAESLITVSRTMAIIELLAASRRGYSLAEISRHLNVNKSIAVRILDTLEHTNYIYRSVNDQRYLLTFKISNVGTSVLYANRLTEQVQPKVRELADQSGELVLLSIIEEQGPRWIMSANGSAGRRLQVDPLIKTELHSTATGKAWLATLPDEEIARRFGQTLTPMTPYTVSTLPGLLKQVEAIRQQGYAISDQENETGIKAISVPIHRAEWLEPSACVGFVSITAPVSRATDADYDRFRTLLLAAARHLGEIWPPVAIPEGPNGSIITVY